MYTLQLALFVLKYVISSHYNDYLFNYFILGSLVIAAKTLALVRSPGHIH